MAQNRIESLPYRTLLRGLLDHSVQELPVASLAANYRQYPYLLDARAPQEFAISHLKGALPVGYENFALSSLDSLDRNKPVVVYCSVGYRSEKIAEKLNAAGFKEVYNLYGGIFEWLNQGQPIYNPQGQPTLKVHGYSRSWGFWLNRGQVVYD
jgi:rhodanese-related sulfurtransferase